MAKCKIVPNKKKAKRVRIFEQAAKEHLKCVLSEEELKLAGEESARYVQEKATQEADKKHSMAAFKARIDGADAKISEESNKIRNGYEYRDVECVTVRNYEKGTIKKIRTDTKEVIVDRKMTLGEKNAEQLL